jgi:hypothetical protein
MLVHGAQAALADMTLVGETCKLMWRVRENIIVRVYSWDEPPTLAVVTHNQTSKEVRGTRCLPLTTFLCVIAGERSKCSMSMCGEGHCMMMTWVGVEAWCHSHGHPSHLRTTL